MSTLKLTCLPFSLGLKAYLYTEEIFNFMVTSWCNMPMISGISTAPQDCRRNFNCIRIKRGPWKKGTGLRKSIHVESKTISVPIRRWNLNLYLGTSKKYFIQNCRVFNLVKEYWRTWFEGPRFNFGKMKITLIQLTDGYKTFFVLFQVLKQSNIWL